VQDKAKFAYNSLYRDRTSADDVAVNIYKSYCNECVFFEYCVADQNAAN